MQASAFIKPSQRGEQQRPSGPLDPSALTYICDASNRPKREKPSGPLKQWTNKQAHNKTTFDLIQTDKKAVSHSAPSLVRLVDLRPDSEHKCTNQPCKLCKLPAAAADETSAATSTTAARCGLQYTARRPCLNLTMSFGTDPAILYQQCCVQSTQRLAEALALQCTAAHRPRALNSDRLTADLSRMSSWPTTAALGPFYLVGWIAILIVFPSHIDGQPDGMPHRHRRFPTVAAGSSCCCIKLDTKTAMVNVGFAVIGVTPS